MDNYEITEICDKFGFNHKKFRAFLEDHFVMSLAELPPFPDEPVELTFDEICKICKLPKNIVRKIQKEGHIGYPITSADFDSLKFLGKLYAKTWLVKAMLSKFGKKDRERLITRPELNRWERWAYSRWINAEIEYGTGDRMLTPEHRIHIGWLMDQIEEIFKVPKCENTRKRLLQIRKMAFNDKQSAKRGASLSEKAKKRIEDDDPLFPL